MPRHNGGRSMGEEENLARRIKMERESRGWSPAQLAERLTEVGCKISTSAIYKIEDGTPRRAIHVDELVALSVVLDVEVPDLLKPMETIRQEKAFELLKGLEDNGRRLAGESWERVKLFEELLTYAVDDPELHEFVMNQRYGIPAGRPRHFQPVAGPDRDVAVDRLADGFRALEAAIIAQAVDSAEAAIWMPHDAQGGNDTLIWPHRDGLIWPRARHSGVVVTV